MIGDEYNNLNGYIADTDHGLGCGLPTEYAGIKKGDTVVDLGSGAGNDVFIARSIVGGSGRVIGTDMTEKMISQANIIKDNLGFSNVDFKLGDIEDFPLKNNIADVVVSNFVLNLVLNKQKAFLEILRVLKSSTHFCISDVVVQGVIPSEFKQSAELYDGCVAGALQQVEYLQLIKDSGFENIEIKKSKK